MDEPNFTTTKKRKPEEKWVAIRRERERGGAICTDPEVCLMFRFSSEKEEKFGGEQAIDRGQGQSHAHF